MEINKKKTEETKLMKLISEIVAEMDMQESDLVARDTPGQGWEELAQGMKQLVDEMLTAITADNYSVALEKISTISGRLKIWKHRIMTGNKKAAGDPGLKSGEVDFNRFSATGA